MFLDSSALYYLLAYVLHGIWFSNNTQLLLVIPFLFEYHFFMSNKIDTKILTVVITVGFVCLVLGGIIGFLLGLKSNNANTLLKTESELRNEANVECSTKTDNICPAWCSAGSDYDCCIQAGKVWADGRGCYDARQ